MKTIAAMNMTLDGFCDHTLIGADEELHDHYSTLLSHAGTILYGRITYQLMEYWKTILNKPTGEKAMDAFAVTMDQIPKVIFSHTLKTLDWETARLSAMSLEEEVLSLKKPEGKDVLIGSPGLIAQLTNLRQIDEYQICIHPLIAGKGLTLFKNIHEQTKLQIIHTKRFKSGAVILSYKRSKS